MGLHLIHQLIKSVLRSSIATVVVDDSIAEQAIEPSDYRLLIPYIATFLYRLHESGLQEIFGNLLQATRFRKKDKNCSRPAISRLSASGDSEFGDSAVAIFPNVTSVVFVMVPLQK